MIDSGSDINVLAEEDWDVVHELGRQDEMDLYEYEVRPGDKVKAFAAHSPLTMLASFKAWLSTEVKGKPERFVKFFIVRGGTKTIIGRHTASSMRLLAMGSQVNTMVVLPCQNSNDEVEFPKMPGELITFDIDDTVVPTKNAYYSIPAAFSKQAAERLAKMSKQRIIERVLRAPRWISGMSAVPKGTSDFRLVVNMRGPNRAIKRSYYPLPRLDEIQRELHGATVFTKLDLSSAFHHVELDEESRELTTFMAEDGMYRFTRLVFGVNCAPEKFQEIMKRKFRDVPGLIIFVDDFLIYAQSLNELEQRTGLVMKILAENNLQLNDKKCEYAKESMPFLGHELSSAGLNIDAVKVAAVRAFRRPNTVKELQSFLGTVGYVNTFIPDYGTLTHDLTAIATGDTLEWSDKAQQAFEKTKEAVIHCTVTKGFFSDTDKTVLWTDASPWALGAVLTQVDSKGVDRIISFASKSLTKTERAYPQIQREALGVVWAAEHFQYHLRGREFLIKTDAKAVAFIFNRERESTKRILSRAEGFALRLSEFRYTIECVSGNDNIADAPSRLYDGPPTHYEERDGPWEIGALYGAAEHVDYDDSILTLEELRITSRQDPVLKHIAKSLRGNEDAGTWTHKASTDDASFASDLALFRAAREELYVDEDLVMKSGMVVVPRELYQKALQVAHLGHPGATATKSILRARVWWPRMDRDVERYVAACESCTLVSRQAPPVPMTRTMLPTSVWESLAIDYNGPYKALNGGLLLVIGDVYSRYLVIAPVASTDFKSLQSVLETLFKQYGYPKTVKCDNGPPFSSSPFETYLAQRGIKKVHSSPYYPQQNGLAERYMQVANKAMQIAGLKGTSSIEMVGQAVRAHNSAKHRITNVSPEELMLGRKVRRGLPLMGSSTVSHDDQLIRERDTAEKLKAKVREDGKRSAKETKIRVGDSVFVRRMIRAKGESRFHPEKWQVTAKVKGDLELQATDGRTIKRNVTLVKKIIHPPYFKYPGLVGGEQRSPGMTKENGKTTPGFQDTPVPQGGQGPDQEREPNRVAVTADTTQQGPDDNRQEAVQPRRSERIRKPSSRLTGYDK